MSAGCSPTHPLHCEILSVATDHSRPFLPESLAESLVERLPWCLRRCWSYSFAEEYFAFVVSRWAGNNEDERDMKTRTLTNTPAYLEAYSLLTFQTALANVSAIDTSRPTTGSSPSDGNETAAKPFSWDHQSEFYGDVHCYLYDVDNWDTKMYKRPRL